MHRGGRSGARLLDAVSFEMMMTGLSNRESSRCLQAEPFPEGNPAKGVRARSKGAKNRRKQRLGRRGDFQRRNISKLRWDNSSERRGMEQTSPKERAVRVHPQQLARVTTVTVTFRESVGR
ncbi:hypothetical protein AVEN_17907-1 [Araneus ventricosus]|uniref:Uncharacterized protein n=1 Tax=Araneus ventricosus TaxID=182803 RepID=A0A4Y2S100_ARAVE|nr:hypothetical protein AVEN_17907-1 [Araneus ventricosus]